MTVRYLSSRCGGRGGSFAPGQRIHHSMTLATNPARLVPRSRAMSPSRFHGGSSIWNDRGGVTRRSAATVGTVTSRSSMLNGAPSTGLRVTCNSATLAPMMLHVADAPVDQVTCMDHACLNAISHESLCTCQCGGHGHGHAHRATRQAARDAIRARMARTGDVFLGAAADDDEEW